MFFFFLLHDVQCALFLSMSDPGSTRRVDRSFFFVVVFFVHPFSAKGHPTPSLSKICRLHVVSA